MYFLHEYQSGFSINEVGYELVYKVKFSIEDVLKFSEVTGDNNPIHTDFDYASKTIFKKPIVHGFLVGSIFSRIFGTAYPGIGTIYLSQTMNFLSPVYLEEFYYAKILLIEVDNVKGRAKVETKIFNINGESILFGEAKLKHDIYINLNDNSN